MEADPTTEGGSATHPAGPEFGTLQDPASTGTPPEERNGRLELDESSAPCNY